MSIAPPISKRLLEVHGHRGCRGLRPENTLPAFLHALALGVDVLEMDVVISADNQVVVSHEPWLNPHICSGPDGQPLDAASAPQRFNLYRMPYAAIRACDGGQRQHLSFPEQVSQPAYKPLLREVLASVEAAAMQLNCPSVGYSIEIKSSPAGDDLFHPTPDKFLSLVVDELSAARVLSRTTLLCFDLRILQLAHQREPSLATCLLVEDNLPWAGSLQQLGFVPTTFGPEFITVTPDAVQKLRTNFPGLRLVPWTVNEPQDMRRLLHLGVEGITTDYPDRLLAITKE